MVNDHGIKYIPGSFRDPCGHLFLKDASLYRQINLVYKKNYDHLIDSGLYNYLVAKDLLIPHAETDIGPESGKGVYKIIKPEIIPFISYPYEWCFSQLKDAALTILKIQKIAFSFGMSLKDSSVYNIQSLRGKFLLIDTLSFEKYNEGQIWAAYGQFCKHFLAPLALMSHADVRLNQLFRIYIDGIPLDLASSLLPLKTFFKFSLFSHIHLHAWMQKYYENKDVKPYHKRLSRLSIAALVDSLESAIKNLKLQSCNNTYIDYYGNNNYSSEAMQSKKKVVGELLDKIKPKTVFDFGANIGIFSQVASGKNMQIVAFDIDHFAVENSYLACRKNKEENILPLLLDLSNPSPGIGWENEERMSFLERSQADAILALALVHHLAIFNNLPFRKMAHFFSRIANSLIIEFVPRTDSQVQRILATRNTAFFDYTQQDFENEFEYFFSLENSVKIKDSERVIYLMIKRC